jgi:hypothetical protein
MTNSVIVRSDAVDRVLDEVISHALFGCDPLVIVKSPPGAGKTFLVECATAVAVSAPAMRVVCITPNVSQVYDVTDRLLNYTLPRIELVHAKHRELPPFLQGRIVDAHGWSPTLNQGPGIVVANAHVLAFYLQQLPAGSFDLAIIDEAYQLAAKDFLPLADIARRVLMVGDPGQLPPVNSVDVSNLEAARHKVHWSAPAYMLDRYPRTPVHNLPVTRRLLPDTAELVQSAFYPDMPFVSAVDPTDRRLQFGIPGLDPAIDRMLDAIGSGASLVGLELPGEPAVQEEVDTALAAVIARVADRILVRQAIWVGHHQLTVEDIGCIDPNVISGGAIANRLRAAGRGGVRVDTAEKWQGLQVPISIVRHPLSRVGKATPFDLTAGRWCVSLSRHQIGCIVVARESVRTTIADYVHACDNAPAGARDDVWTGYRAHRMVWDDLIRRDRLFRV